MHHSLYDDNRKRTMVFPTRIVKTFGNVSSAENLLKHADPQIGLTEPDCVSIENGSDAVQSGVLLDFGRELHGSLRILTFLTKGSSPAKVRITLGESVSEALSGIGEKNATNDHAVRDTEYLLPSYSDITLNESGFRFACLRLIGENCGITVRSVMAVSILRNVSYKGSFKCDNEIINRIYDTAAYTCHLCLQRYIWDGIKRDRLVWVGDMHPEMLTVRTVFGALPIVDDTLSFIRDATPLPGWMNNFPTYSLWWLIIVRDWYFYEGSKLFLEKHAEYFIALADQVSATVNPDGSDSLGGYFLDWPTDRTEDAVKGSRALLIMALEASAEIAEVCGMPEKVKEYLQKASILKAYKQEAPTAKQAIAMTSLAGCCDEIEAAEKILLNGAEGFSTFMSYYLLKAASKADMAKTLGILEEYYGAMLSLGATTFWEDFNISWMDNAAPIDEEVPDEKSDVHGDNGAFCYTGLRHSLCHGWSSAPTAFLAEEVLGIHIMAPGCKKIKLTPNLGNLSFARGEYPTPLGILTVSCKKEPDGSVSVEWDAPKGMEVIV